MNWGACCLLKAKKLVTFVLACSMVFSGVGMSILPTATVSAADASGTTASMSDILKNQRADGGGERIIARHRVSGPNQQLITKLHTQRLEDLQVNSKKQMIRDTRLQQSRALTFC